MRYVIPQAGILKTRVYRVIAFFWKSIKTQTHAQQNWRHIIQVWPDWNIRNWSPKFFVWLLCTGNRIMFDMSVALTRLWLEIGSVRLNVFFWPHLLGTWAYSVGSCSLCTGASAAEARSTWDLRRKKNTRGRPGLSISVYRKIPHSIEVPPHMNYCVGVNSWKAFPSPSIGWESH